MCIATISSQRQITLPKRVLDDLGVQPKGKLRLEVKQGKLELEPLVGSLTQQLSGSLAHLVPEDKKGTSWDVVMKETRQIVAEKLAHEH